MIDLNRYRFTYPVGFTSVVKSKSYPFLHITPNLLTASLPIPLDAPLIYSASMLAWYRSDSVILSGSLVISMLDKSGNNRHLTNSLPTPLLYPTYIKNDPLINNQPSVIFNGITNFLSGTIWNLGGATDIGYYVFCVYNPFAWANNGIWDFSVNFATNDYAQLMHESTIRVRNHESVVLAWTDPPTNTPTYTTVAYATGTSEMTEVWQKTISQGSNSSTALTKPNNLRIGSLFQNVYYFSGSYAELIIFSGSLSTQGRLDIQNYIATRYGIL
jgi:hypothetical protein